jgi:transcriptional regulator with XRE-family HTH domain
VKTSFEADLIRFGKVVKGLRKSRAMTQLHLASQCDLDIRTVQRIEKGEFNPSLKVLLRLAKAFDMPISQLLKSIDPPY